MGNTKLFADRMFITVNGFELLHCVTGSVKRNANLQRVETMTRNKRTAGYRSGNLGIQVDVELDIEQKSAQIDPFLGSDDTDINLVAECGGERYIVKGLKESSMELSGSVGGVINTFTAVYPRATTSSARSTKILGSACIWDS